MDASGVLLTSAVPDNVPPTPPAVVPVPTSTTDTLLSLKSVVTSDVSQLRADLVKLVTDLVDKKPTTKAEAVALYTSLTVKLGPLLVSELPAAEKKAAVLGLWAVDEVKKCCGGCGGCGSCGSCGSCGCFSFWSKKK